MNTTEAMALPSAVNRREIAPGLRGRELVAGDRDGKRTLTIRDGQHEYVFVER